MSDPAGGESRRATLSRPGDTVPPHRAGIGRSGGAGGMWRQPGAKSDRTDTLVRSRWRRPRPRRCPAGPATYVANGPRTADAVALTFHGSGDVALTQELLASAHQLSAPITVFGVGTWMEANPALADQILAGGHTLGNHTYTHPDLGSLDAPAVADEIQRCATVLERLEGSNGRWFRPSGIVVPTSLILDQAGLAGYPVSVGYDVDPLDYEDPGSAAIIARVTQALRPGSDREPPHRSRRNR